MFRPTILIFQRKERAGKRPAFFPEFDLRRHGLGRTCAALRKRTQGLRRFLTMSSGAFSRGHAPAAGSVVGTPSSG